MPDDSNKNQPNPPTPPPFFVVYAPPPPIGQGGEPPASTENVETPPPPIVAQEGNSQTYDIPPVVTNPKPQGKGKKGMMIATILGILLLVGGVGAGVFLVQRNQNIRSRAAGGGHWNESGYNYCDDSGCDVGSDYPNCIVMHYGSKDADDPVVDDFVLRDRVQSSYIGLQDCGAEQIDVGCGSPLVDVGWTWYRYDYDCTEPTEPPTTPPTVPPTTPPTAPPGACGSECIQSNDTCPDPLECLFLSAPNIFTCQNPSCPGDADCVCSTPTPPPAACGAECNPSNDTCQGSLECLFLAAPNIFTCQNPSCPGDADCVCSTPTPPPAGFFSCLALKAYDTSWTLLSLSDLAKLKAGNIVRFTVAGNTNYGEITKAMFEINNACTQEVTNKKPGPVPCEYCSSEFYYDYTIPSGVTSFTVNARLYVEGFGWMGGIEHIDLSCTTPLPTSVPSVD